MRVLVACEHSGTVRDEFIARGHDAMSCDLLPSDVSGPHYQGDVFDIISDGWDLMIAHPPCTYLCSSGLHWNKRRPERVEMTEAALDFVRRLMDAPIPRIVIENPIGCISTRIRKPDQIIQPHEFGHPESKATCLWLKGLPKLWRTNILPARARWENQTASGQNKLPPSSDRWKTRSKTYTGIARAFAEQYGCFTNADRSGDQQYPRPGQPGQESNVEVTPGPAGAEVAVDKDGRAPGTNKNGDPSRPAQIANTATAHKE